MKTSDAVRNIQEIYNRWPVYLTSIQTPQGACFKRGVVGFIRNVKANVGIPQKQREEIAESHPEKALGESP